MQQLQVNSKSFEKDKESKDCIGCWIFQKGIRYISHRRWTHRRIQTSFSFEYLLFARQFLPAFKWTNFQNFGVFLLRIVFNWMLNLQGKFRIWSFREVIQEQYIYFRMPVHQKSFAQSFCMKKQSLLEIVTEGSGIVFSNPFHQMWHYRIKRKWHLFCVFKWCM